MPGASAGRCHDPWVVEFPDAVALAARAGFVLGANTNGRTGAIRPAAALYPHQWSWDTAFIAIGLAGVDPARACKELDLLFAGQWGNGMVPHIVFSPDAEGYFPGPDRWACAELTPLAPREPLTSGICQPPVHAIAAVKILDEAGRGGPEAVAEPREWLAGFYPKLVAWHRFLARERTDPATGLVWILHGWESGMDNSPRWDRPYSAVRVPGTLPPYVRRDLAHVADAAQRPSREEYDRYLWLVEEEKQAHYDQAALAVSSSFRVGDVFFSAIFAAANESLAQLADLLGAPEAAELRSYADVARAAVLAQADPETGLAADLDLRTGQRLSTKTETETGTVAGFAPLIAGGAPRPLHDQLLAALFSPCWAGDPRMRWALPPSTSTCSSGFRPRTYWRGPVWPVVNWLLSWSLLRAGEKMAAGALRQAGLSQLAVAGDGGGGEFAEYYEPFTGEPLGSLSHSWTAAVALEWLGDDWGA